MNDDRKLDQLLDAWLDGGPTVAPNRVTEAARLETRATRQSAALPGWTRRFPSMNNTMRYGVVAAGMAVAAVLGFSLLASPNVGNPGLGEPSPTPRPSPRSLADVPAGEELEPGSYEWSTVGSLTVSLTVPEGWTGFDLGVAKEESSDSFAAVAVWPSDTEVGQVYADPCQWSAGTVEPAVGPTVDDLATALADQPQRGDAIPTDVSIGGYNGKMIELTVPDDIDLADCDQGEFRSWNGRFHQGPGQVDRIYILDVDGQRVVIDAHHLPAASEAVRTEQEAIVASLRFER